MGPQDHMELAISAAAHCIHELGRDDTLFVFIGSGESLDAARKQAADLGLGDRVRFTGWLEEGRCFDYLATADLALDSNLQPEVTPVKGLEYMAHGLPFVAFDLEETRAMAASAARYVPPAMPSGWRRRSRGCWTIPASAGLWARWVGRSSGGGSPGICRSSVTSHWWTASSSPPAART